MLAPPRDTGLLEQPLLLAGRGPRVLAAPDGTITGVVRKVPSGVRGWLLGSTLAVHEAGEEPLVFIVRPCWSLFRRWAVLDADGEPVGTVGGPWLLGRWDEPALVRAGDGSFRTPAGIELGRWDGRTLAFAPGLAADPFARMLMLAAVLVG